jgi:hypothetical protein
MEFIWQTFVATLPGVRSYFAVIAIFFIAERFFRPKETSLCVTSFSTLPSARPH